MLPLDDAYAMAITFTGAIVVAFVDTNDDIVAVSTTDAVVVASVNAAAVAVSPTAALVACLFLLLLYLPPLSTTVLYLLHLPILSLV